MTHLLSSLRRRLPGWLNTRTGLSTGVRLVLATGAIFTVLLSSVSLYLMFYRLYVPTLLHQAPVYLQYPTAAQPANTTAVVSFVTAHDYKFLSTSQAYTVALRFRAPTSEENQRLGSFMVGVELCTARGQVVQAGWRPTLMPYHSPVVRLAQTFLRLPLLVLGVADEAETLHVDMIDGLYDRHFSPVTHARVSLSKPLQTYGAEILIRAQFTGLRYWMYYWRVPTALVFVAAAVVWQMVFTAVAWSVLESYAGKARAGAGARADSPPAEQHVPLELTGPESRSPSTSRSRSQLRRRARGSKSRSASESSHGEASHDEADLRQVPAL